VFVIITYLGYYERVVDIHPCQFIFKISKVTLIQYSNTLMTIIQKVQFQKMSKSKVIVIRSYIPIHLPSFIVSLCSYTLLPFFHVVDRLVFEVKNKLRHYSH